MKLKQAMIATLLLVLLPLSTEIFANEGNRLDGEPCPRHWGSVDSTEEQEKHDLQLTSAQEDQIFKLMYVQMPIMRELEKKRILASNELRKLAQSDKFDDIKAQKLADNFARLEKEIELAKIRYKAEVFALLTQEQRQAARKHENRTGKRRPHGFFEPDFF